MINLEINRQTGACNPFTTAKHKYIPFEPGAPIGISRWRQYERINIVFGANKTFTELYEEFRTLLELMASDNPVSKIRTEAILRLNTLITGISSESQDRYSKAFFLCTVFMYREGTDKYEWSVELANEMIRDWEESRVNEQDLFFFALTRCSGLNSVLKNIREEKAAQMQDLTGSSLADIG
jgi:hypothetical protein